MRYQILLTILILSLIANISIAQKSQLAAINKSIVPVETDSSDFDAQAFMGNLHDNLVPEEDLIFRMPILKPGNLDAKMKYWWPSIEYDYNMPNAYPKGSKSFNFDFRKDKN